MDLRSGDRERSWGAKPHTIHRAVSYLFVVGLRRVLVGGSAQDTLLSPVVGANTGAVSQAPAPVFSGAIPRAVTTHSWRPHKKITL